MKLTGNGLISAPASNSSIKHGQKAAFSTSSQPVSKKQQKDSKDNNKESIQWLYKRTPNDMTKPRVILGVASFHTIYWSWYCLDFMPAVNASPIENLHIDPVVGYVGMFFSIFVNLGALLYPKSLVSGIGIRDGELCVFTHSTPIMSEAKEGVVYEIGDVKMDPSTQETKKIVETLGGDFGAYRGFVALKADRRRLPYLLQIQDSTEVMDSWMLLQVLVNPQLAKKEIERSSRSKGNDDVDDEKTKRSGKRGGKKSARGRRSR